MNGILLFKVFYLISLIQIGLGRKDDSSREIELSELNSRFEDFFELLTPIAIKRVSDTDGNQVVREYISSKMREYGWIIEHDQFKDRTPYGIKNFVNIIATYPVGNKLTTLRNSRVWSNGESSMFHINNRVVFACHYDSKFFTEFEFIGATDSAVPCAMLLDLAKFLKENFNRTEFNSIKRHVQFMFFDGEEAFKDWSHTDSIYGSRNLANYLNNKYEQNAFDSIDLFVLLDLIGGQKSSFLNYFPETSNVYQSLSKMESILIRNKMLSKDSPFFFTDTFGFGRMSQIDDDYRPFSDKGVPILHLIPMPFPDQWHKEADNLENIDVDNIQDLRILLKYFLLRILKINVLFD